MEDIKLIEKLRDKANISYEEAKEVLEKNNWDIEVVASQVNTNPFKYE